MVFQAQQLKPLVLMLCKSYNNTVFKSTQFLEVINYNKLRLNNHIIYVKNAILKSLGIFTKLDDSTTQLTNMYYSFVFPYLIYCVEIWGSSLKSYLDPLVKIQKKCIRTISFSEYFAPSEPLFPKLNILNLNKLVIQRIRLMMLKLGLGRNRYRVLEISGIGYRVNFKVSVSPKNPIPIPSTFRYYFDTLQVQIF